MKTLIEFTICAVVSILLVPVFFTVAKFLLTVVLDPSFQP